MGSENGQTDRGRVERPRKMDDVALLGTHSPVGRLLTP
jgi:hypothetical protein